MRLFQTLFACAFGLTAACSTEPVAVLPPPVDHDAQGLWGEDTHGVLLPGFSFIMTLTESGGAMAGVGSFAGEAAPYGSLSVTGTVRHDTVSLQIVYVAEPTVFPLVRPDTAHFAGVLTTKNQVGGQLTSHGNARPFDLVRLVISDPH